MGSDYYKYNSCLALFVLFCFLFKTKVRGYTQADMEKDSSKQNNRQVNWLGKQTEGLTWETRDYYEELNSK